MLVTTKNVESIKQTARAIKFGISAEDASHLMEVLSDIYKDTTLAVIREYTTNALDSHADAGQTRPVEISSPGPLDPNFSVEDFGVGLSIDDLENIYCKYGKSTKRTTNDQTGSIGIGAKAAIAYTGQFMVRARKDGRQVVGTVSCDENGNPVMDIMHESDTTEPNGVKITIPVHGGWREFSNKITNFTRYVPAGKLQVDGSLIDNSYDRVEHAPDIFTTTSGYNRIVVVMGGVGYPVDITKFSKLNSFGKEILFFVPMGSVHFTPSREDLNYTQHTIKTLNEYVDRFIDVVYANLQDKINLAPDYPSAIEIYHNNKRMLARLGSEDRELSYNGKPITAMYAKFSPSGLIYSWSSERMSHYGDSLYFESRIPHIVIKNFSNEKFTRTQARKLDAYMAAKHPSEPNKQAACVLSPHNDQLGFIENFFVNKLVIDWDEVKKFKYTTTGGKRIKRTVYPMFDGYGVSEMAIDESKPIYYGQRDDFGGRDTWTMRQICSPMHVKGHQIVFVPASQTQAFRNNYPSAKFFRRFYEEALDTFFAKVSATDKAVIEKAMSKIHNGDLINIEDIEDPRFAGYGGKQTLTDDQVALWKEYTDLQGYYRRTGSVWSRSNPVETRSFNHSDAEIKFDEYPLLNGVQMGYSGSRIEVRKAMTEYVNHIYNTQIKEG